MEKLNQFERVRLWATNRNLYKKGDPKTQFVKLIEEVGETGRAILKDDKPEIKDGLGDAFVVLVNLAHLCGYTLEECIEEALQVIESRTGKMINGTFVKSEDLK
jgi:NTP pyrophosphatase (non-canonical NTP hydrolase)